MTESTSRKSLTAKELERYFSEEFVLLLFPVLFIFTSTENHLVINIYHIFRHERRHCKPLGVRGMLKEFIVYLLGDKPTLSSAIGRQNRNLISFKLMKPTVLTTLKSFLERCYSNAVGCRLKLDIFETRSSDCPTRLFNNVLTCKMLGESGLDSMDNILPS